MASFKSSVAIRAQKIHGVHGDYYNYLIRVQVAGAYKNFSVGVRTPLEYWNEQTRNFEADMATCDEALQLYKMCNDMKDILLRYDLAEHRPPTLVELTEAFQESRGIRKAKRSSLVNDAIIRFSAVEGARKGWADATYAKFETLRKHFKDYGEYLKVRGGLDLSQVTEELLQDMFVWLEQKKGLRNTTLTKYVVFVRWFLNWAEDDGIYHEGANKSWKPEFRGGQGTREIIYLEQEELRAIMDFVPKRGQAHLDHVRDIFLFSAYSSLRYIDVVKLTWAQVTDGYFDTVPVKTTDPPLRIILNAHTRALLDKYRGRSFPGGKVFPPISNQKANKYLHELCQVLGFDREMLDVFYKGTERIERVVPRYELITFHSGRRSFITHALRLGMPTPVIRKFSGHKSDRMLEPYMAVVDELREKEMAKFDTM